MISKIPPNPKHSMILWFAMSADDMEIPTISTSQHFKAVLKLLYMLMPGLQRVKVGTIHWELSKSFRDKKVISDFLKSCREISRDKYVISVILSFKMTAWIWWTVEPIHISALQDKKSSPSHIWVSQATLRAWTN